MSDEHQNRSRVTEDGRYRPSDSGLGRATDKCCDRQVCSAVECPSK